MDKMRESLEVGSMSIRFTLLAMAAGILFGLLTARAAQDASAVSPVDVNPMKSVSADQTAGNSAPFDFAASPLNESPAIAFTPTSPAPHRATAKEAGDRSVQTEEGPAVIPLPPAAWTGAAGLLALGAALGLRKLRHAHR